jgi:hypothetical protein
VTEEGQKLLTELYEKKLSNFDTGLSAAYLSILAAGNGNTELAIKLRQDARTHVPDHPLLDRLLGPPPSQETTNPRRPGSDDSQDPQSATREAP